MSLPRIAFFYLRHGQTDWNVEGRCQGQADVPLNAAGRAEVARTVARLEAGQVQRIVSSPLARARESAEIASEVLGLPVTLDDGLKEAFWGAWEGGTDRDWLPGWRLGETSDGVEPFDAFTARIAAATARALAGDGTALIVGHGAAYWSLERTLGRDGFGHLPNGTLLHHAPRDADGWRVTFV